MLHITDIMGKKISKALAAVVLLVILGYFGGAWYSGTQADEQVNLRTQNINAQLRSNGLPVQVSSEKTDSGLFSSNYMLTLRIDNAGQSYSLDFNVHIEHGPLPLSRLQQGLLEPVQAYSHVALVNNEKTARLFELSQGRPPLQLQLTTHFDGHTQYQGHLASLSFNNQRDGQLHFDGMTFEGKIDAANRQAEFAGSMPLMQVTPPQNDNGTSTLILRDLALYSQYDGRNTETPLWQQQSTLAAFSLAGENAQLEIEQFQTDAKAQPSDNLLALQQNTVMNRVRINGVDLGKLQYAVAATRLDRAGAMQFMAQIWQQLAHTPGSGESGAPQQQWMPLLASLDLMLSNQPELALGPIIWTLPEGAAKASVNLSINNPVPLLSQFGNDPYALLLNTLRSVRIEVDADKAMPQGVADRLAQLRSPHAVAPETAARSTSAENLDAIIDVLVSNQLLFSKQEHIGLSVSLDGDPSLVSAGDINMNGEQFDPVEFVSAIQTRAAAAEQQIRQLTPQQPVSPEDPSQDDKGPDSDSQ
ncbi:MAG: YdgA family protein [Advenella sp.]